MHAPALNSACPFSPAWHFQEPRRFGTQNSPTELGTVDDDQRELSIMRGEDDRLPGLLRRVCRLVGSPTHGVTVNEEGGEKHERWRHNAL